MNNNCKPGSKQAGRVVGAIFLIVGSVLTLLTHSDAGILGFFIAGALLCIKPKSSCSPCGSCGSCGCCCDCGPQQNSAVEVHQHHSELLPKKVAKTTAKPGVRGRKPKKPV